MTDVTDAPTDETLDADTAPVAPPAPSFSDFPIHPDIVDAQVIGVPDEKYGEELCAWIRMRDGSTPLDAAAVREFATGKLAHYKIPRYVKVVDDFPMTVTGKVRKVEMREITVGELGLRPGPSASA